MIYHFLRVQAYILGWLEFRSDLTQHFDDYGLLEAYDAGREHAHMLTMRRFDSNYGDYGAGIIVDLAASSDSELIAELRRRGMAVCVFQAGDMEGFGDPSMSYQQRLDSIRGNLEDRMVELGWEAIRVMLGHNDEMEF